LQLRAELHYDFPMRIVAILLIVTSSVWAQARPAPRTTARPNPDQLGMACSEIIAMNSTDWITKFTAAKGADGPATIRAIDVYGKCYDERTDELAASLAKSGKGPSAYDRTNFQNMEQALKSFTTKGLADSQPSADAVKSAYAGLYEKQFRYEFYEAYEPPQTPNAPTSTAKDSAAPSQGTGKSAVTADDADNSDSDPVTDAKNHFGGLLNDLPDDKLRELHIAFGEILGPNAASTRMQLLIYRYAIFLLEPPGGQPFSPPPF
jgi:hypothetical protein